MKDSYDFPPQIGDVISYDFGENNVITKVFDGEHVFNQEKFSSVGIITKIVERNGLKISQKA